MGTGVSGLASENQKGLIKRADLQKQCWQKTLQSSKTPWWLVVGKVRGCVVGK